MSTPQNPHDDAAQEAQAKLDQLRTQSGAPLSGPEIAARRGQSEPPIGDPPPLDWRLTPRNVIYQLLALALFAAVVWFMGTLFFGGVMKLLG